MYANGKQTADISGSSRVIKVLAMEGACILRRSATNAENAGTCQDLKHWFQSPYMQDIYNFYHIRHQKSHPAASDVHRTPIATSRLHVTIMSFIEATGTVIIMRRLVLLRFVLFALVRFTRHRLPYTDGSLPCARTS